MGSLIMCSKFESNRERVREITLLRTAAVIAYRDERAACAPWRLCVRLARRWTHLPTSGIRNAANRCLLAHEFVLQKTCVITGGLFFTIPRIAHEEDSYRFEPTKAGRRSRTR